MASGPPLPSTKPHSILIPFHLGLRWLIVWALSLHSHNDNLWSGYGLHYSDKLSPVPRTRGNLYSELPHTREQPEAQHRELPNSEKMNLAQSRTLTPAPEHFLPQRAPLLRLVLGILALHVVTYCAGAKRFFPHCGSLQRSGQGSACRGPELGQGSAGLARCHLRVPGRPRAGGDRQVVAAAARSQGRGFFIHVTPPGHSPPGGVMIGNWGHVFRMWSQSAACICLTPKGAHK